MDFEKFKEHLHESWWDKLKPFIESDACDRIYDFLKKESARGKKLAPLSSNVWRAFKETSYDDLKLVMMGLSPYHTFKGNVPIADGLLMGCSITNQLQPSLEQFYNSLQRELNIVVVKTPDVSYLSHQGILMFNASLTTEYMKPGSHIPIWEPFVKYLFENVLDITGTPIVFLGKEASKYKKYVTPFTWTFEISHPASASYKGVDWDSEGIFTKINTLLKNNNNFTINWNCEII